MKADAIFDEKPPEYIEYNVFEKFEMFLRRLFGFVLIFDCAVFESLRSKLLPQVGYYYLKNWGIITPRIGVISLKNGGDITSRMSLVNEALRKTEAFVKHN